MTPQSVVNQVLTMFGRLGAAKDARGSEAWIEAYLGALEPFKGEVLAKGWKKISGQWDKGWPPLPADIRRACLEAIGQPAVQATAGMMEVRKKRMWPHKDVADRVMRTDLGQWALANGVGNLCWEYAAQHGVPASREWLEREGNVFHGEVKDCLFGDTALTRKFPDLARSLQSLYRSFVALEADKVERFGA